MRDIYMLHFGPLLPQVERQQLLKRIRCHDCFEKQRELDKIYRCLRGICKQCSKVHASAPPVLPRALYGNELLCWHNQCAFSGWSTSVYLQNLNYFNLVNMATLFYVIYIIMSS